MTRQCPSPVSVLLWPKVWRAVLRNRATQSGHRCGTYSLGQLQNKMVHLDMFSANVCHEMSKKGLKDRTEALTVISQINDLSINDHSLLHPQHFLDSNVHPTNFSRLSYIPSLPLVLVDFGQDLSALPLHPIQT